MSEKKPWSGRFSEDVSPLLEAYGESVSFDRILYLQDIKGSMAHARMLAKQGILEKEEADSIIQGLETVRKEIERGEFTWRTDLEDVHMNIENRLTELIGPAGRKLHTGRSRNDQIALDFRLYTAERLEHWAAAAAAVVEALAAKAEALKDAVMPGYTHLQPAQPVSPGHHLSAYCCMFLRDIERIRDAEKRVKVSPLGAAALAGTTYPLDPEQTAREVGFDRTFTNSMDAVSDRDFVLEALFIASVMMAHLSRLCEEIILWANPGFGFITLPDAFSTGSSIMPQKKNPDTAELMRGKTGRVYGSLMTMLTIIKGLPLTYNRDLQEDKEPFFDADRTVSASLEIMAAMVPALEFNREAMRRAVTRGYLNATELADYLVGKGIPFREAHHITGRITAEAESRGIALEALSLMELKNFSELFEEDVFDALDYDNAVARRKTPGGTAPESVEQGLKTIRKRLQELMPS